MDMNQIESNQKRSVCDASLVTYTSINRNNISCSIRNLYERNYFIMDSIRGKFIQYWYDLHSSNEESRKRNGRICAIRKYFDVYQLNWLRAVDDWKQYDSQAAINEGEAIRDWNCLENILTVANRFYLWIADIATLLHSNYFGASLFRRVNKRIVCHGGTGHRLFSFIQAEVQRFHWRWLMILMVHVQTSTVSQNAMCLRRCISGINSNTVTVARQFKNDLFTLLHHRFW